MKTPLLLIIMRARLEQDYAVDVDSFLMRADQIIADAKSNPRGLGKVREEARNLMAQFEEFLKSRGL